MIWGDVDLGRREAVIRQTKVAGVRRAHLPPEVVASLANIPSDREPAAPVFGYVAPGSVRKPWGAAVARARIERLMPHSCRHGFAAMMLRKGFDVATVARPGGWKDAGTVLKHHAHAREDLTLTDAFFDAPATHGAGALDVTTDAERMKA